MEELRELVAKGVIEVDFESASVRNDLAPPRPEDRIGNQLGNRFSERLRAQIEQGRYHPFAASILQASKPGSVTRPAALMTMEDRAVLGALVNSMRPRVEQRLLGPDVVFWPRGTRGPSRWREFEEAGSDGAYVAVADISSYYASISHARLEDALIALTGMRLVARATRKVLDSTLDPHSGIPQGVESSDLLATAFLDSVDRTMIREGFRYYRHGDDVRIAGDSYEQVRHAIFTFEDAFDTRA